MRLKQLLWLKGLLRLLRLLLPRHQLRIRKLLRMHVLLERRLHHLLAWRQWLRRRAHLVMTTILLEQCWDSSLKLAPGLRRRASWTWLSTFWPLLLLPPLGR